MGTDAHTLHAAKIRKNIHPTKFSFHSRQPTAGKIGRPSVFFLGKKLYLCSVKPIAKTSTI